MTDDYLIYVPSCYKDILEIFSARLKMKHLLKGVSHRDKTVTELQLIVEVELRELEDEIEIKHETKTIEEALDVMISAMLVADRIIQGDAYNDD